MTKRGLGLIAYGTEGIGKTSFALQFKKDLLFLSIEETGYEDLDMVGEVPPGCTNEYVSSFNELIKMIKVGKDFATLVVDSLSGVQKLFVNDIIRTVYKDQDNPEAAFGAFYSGHKQHAPIWAAKLTTEFNLLRSKGVNVVLIGHTKQETVTNITGTNYLSAELSMERWARDVFTEWAQAVLFMTLHPSLAASKKWKKEVTQAKVTDSLEEEAGRIMYTTKHAAHSAKNRLQLPPYILLGDSAEEAYSNFFSKLPPKIQEDQLAA